MKNYYKIRIVVQFGLYSEIVSELSVSPQEIHPTTTFYEWLEFIVAKYEKEFGDVIEVNVAFDYAVEEE